MIFQIVIPVYEEFDNLKILLPKLDLHHDKIIIIDGSKSNNTRDLCRNFNINYYEQKTRGKGAALIESIQYISSDVIVFMDADLAHDPNLLKKIVAPICNGDFVHVSGSRMLGGSSELFSDTDHMCRLFGSLIINFLISRKFTYKITDAQNGYRAIHKSLLNKIKITSNHTTFEQELVGRTLALGYPILEIPAHEYARVSGKSKISILRHGLSYIFSLITILCLSSKKIDIVVFNTTFANYLKLAL